VKRISMVAAGTLLGAIAVGSAVQALEPGLDCKTPTMIAEDFGPPTQFLVFPGGANFDLAEIRRKPGKALFTFYLKGCLISAVIRPNSTIIAPEVAT
jgi:hypothetical protein